MLTATELADMRQAILEALPDTGQVTRPTRAADGLGGQTVTYTTAIAAVACRLSLPTGGTPGISQLGKEIAERLGNRTIFVASFPYNTDVRDGDRLAVNGKTYEVLAIINGSWEIARRAMVARVD